MLEIPAELVDEIVAHCIAGLPDEACGLIGGSVVPAAGPGARGAGGHAGPGGNGEGDPSDAAITRVVRWYPAANAEGSALRYTLDPRAHLLAERACEAEGLEIVGVVHSHTHTDPYPSPTDVAQAPDPAWHYAIVSLRHPEPAMRSYRITGGNIVEEPVVVVERLESQSD